MTHENAPTGASETPTDPRPPSPIDPTEKPILPKHKRRRRIILCVFVPILALLLIVALTPTVLSSGPGRTFVLDKINEKLNGRITVADWSIGWIGGIQADDMKIFDDKDRQILQIPRIKTQLSLLGILRGNYHFGTTSIQGLDFFAERFPNGTINFAQLTRSPFNLQSINGSLELMNCRGTFQDDQNPDKSRQATEFRKIAGDLKITGINDPIEQSLQIVAYSGDGLQIAKFPTPGKVWIAGENRPATLGKMMTTPKLVEDLLNGLGKTTDKQ